MKKLRILSLSVMISTSLMLNSCVKEKEPTPTKTRMEGFWEVTEAYDSNGKDILSKINFPVTAFQLSSDNTIVSTGAPMFMNVVYGDSKYTEIASKVDQCFNYAGLDLTGGEFFVDGGVVDRFTIEMKLEGLPGQKALTELLDLLGIGKDYLDLVVYHKFLNVKVGFKSEDVPEGGEAEVMYWDFDATTTARYNTKDKYGDYVLWNGWPVTKFSHCRFVLTKRVKDVKTMIQEATKAKTK